MLIGEKRLRRIIAEEITAAWQGGIEGWDVVASSEEEIVTTDDENCFFALRARSIPPGRLRDSRAGRGLALDSVMSAIMDHPSLSTVSASDLEWDIVDEDWEDDLSSVAILGRGCKDSDLASLQIRDAPEDTGEISSDTEEIESDEEEAESLPDDFVATDDNITPDDTGEIEQDDDWHEESLMVSPGDGRVLEVSDIAIGLASNNNMYFNDQEYEVTLAEADRNDRPSRYRRAQMRVESLWMNSPTEMHVSGKIIVPFSGEREMETMLSSEDIEPYIADIENGERTITMGPFPSPDPPPGERKGPDGFIILVKQ